MLASRIKIYQDTQRYECYEIEKISGEYYVKKFHDKGWVSKNWKVIGKSNSFEEATAIAHSDAKKYGDTYKIEND